MTARWSDDILLSAHLQVDAEVPLVRMIQNSAILLSHVVTILGKQVQASHSTEKFFRTRKPLEIPDICQFNRMGTTKLNINRALRTFEITICEDYAAICIFALPHMQRHYKQFCAFTSMWHLSLFLLGKYFSRWCKIFRTNMLISWHTKRSFKL